MVDDLQRAAGRGARDAADGSGRLAAEGEAASTARIQSLEQVFRAHRDRPWIFIRPGGNWGDHLIYAGAEALAGRCGIRWEGHDAATFASASTTDDHALYLHGGGGYNSWGSGRPFALLRNAVARPVSVVVQGPQTIEASQPGIASRFAESLSDIRARHIVFFARERLSLTTLGDLALPGVETALDHDTAFHLDRGSLLALAKLERMPGGRYDLTVLRDDDERPDSTRGERARGAILDPAYVATSFAHWLRIHLFARRILTNRLHSAIAGALAGKAVTLAPGSYHKNRSIWEFSLAERGVQWTDGIQKGSRAADWLPRRLRKSYKLERLVFFVRGVPLR